MIQEQKIYNPIRHQTIVSIVTPLGEGGIGKIVVSGPDALHIVNGMFRGKGITDILNAVSQRLYYGHIQDKGHIIDEVIVSIIKQQDSFTGEDVVEINCHGGIRVVMRIYGCLQSSGAEGVAWDSLLLQSVENKRLDCIQKEALQEVVNARTKLAAKVLLDQYRGALSGAIKQGLEVIGKIRRSYHPHPNPPPSRGREALPSPITSEKASGELPPPHPLSGKEPDNSSRHTCPSPCERGLGGGENDPRHSNGVSVPTLASIIGSLLESASFGMALTTPQPLVILGKPNVGKSTIINAILGEERMLVHHEPGTTRDYVSEYISVEGIPFEIVDTAGIRHTSDVLEVMSIEMTQEQLQRASKVMVVFDNARPFDAEDERIADAVHSWLAMNKSENAQQKTSVSKVIPVVNKCDLPARLERARIEAEFGQSLCLISARNKEGFEELNRRLVREFDTVYKPMKPVIFNKRQVVLLSKAGSLLKQIPDHFIAEKTLHIMGEVESILRACLHSAHP
ncbi:MAG: GTPase [Candidatus Brocadiaceae bacterium]